MRYLLLSSMVLLTWTLVASAPVSAAVKDFMQPNAYAVVIGISQYREEVIPKVPYAVQDAQAMATLLETQGGIPKTHIRVLTDSKATSADLRTIGEWFRMRAKTDSTLYVYYAGHGTPNPKTGEAFLVPWDGHPDYPSGLYSLKDLYGTLNSLPAKNVLVMLDSCFSGSSGRSVLAKGGRPMVISVENPILAGGKVIVLAAATGNQISSDYEKASHGLFTHALLAGLQGEADANQDGLVTLQEVFPYVRQRVAETAVEELNREQTPVLLPGEDTLGQRLATPLAGAAASQSTATKSRPPGLTLSKAEQELKALEEQERQMDEEARQTTLLSQIEEKKRQIEKKKKTIEEARARAEAPLQDVLQFIQAQFEAKGTLSESQSGFRLTDKPLNFSGCTIVIRNSMVNETIRTMTDYTVPLAEIDIEKITVKPNAVWKTYDVALKTLNAKKVIRVNPIENKLIGTFVDDDFRSSVPPSTHETGFMFPNQDVATKVAEGFARAAKLCSGKG